MTGSNQLTFVRVFLLISIISIAAHHGFAASTSKYIPHSSNFVGEGTNELATALLQGFVNEERNFVFSPLGYSVILGVMAEGARGKTRGQLVEALHLPEDTTAVRGTYKSVLSSMKSCLLCTDENSEANDPRPQFKNWFYVYKNFTIHDNFRKVIEENYNTEVKSVESPDCYESEMKFTFSSFDTSGDKKDEVVEEGEEEEEKRKKDGMKVEKVEEINKDGKTSEKKAEEMKVADMKVEKVKIEEMKEEKLKIEEMKESVEKVEEVKDEKMKEEKVNTEEEKKKNTYVGEEDKIAEEATPSSVESETESSAPFSMEPISSLSVNRIAGKSKDGSEKNIHSKMITFNGLYYRGKWGLPVEKVANDSGDMTFYLSENNKKQVSMLRAQGLIESGKIDALNCDAVELPYEGGKYSMLLLLPNSNGLNKLIADMAGFSLSNIYKELSSAQSEVYFPKFMFQTISKPEQVLKKYGVEDIFTEGADLSGISENEGLFLDELVQLVTIEADESSSQANFFSVGAVTRNNFQTIKFNRPFLFFIRDKSENVILAAGKVINP